jgi:hypothetical protein
LTWLVVAAIAALSCVIAYVFFEDKNYVVAAGNLYFTLFVLLPFSQRYAQKRWATMNTEM